MNERWIPPVSVKRTVFLAGHAECTTCRAHVRPTPAAIALARVVTAKKATAWCSVCCTPTTYDLDPLLAA
jgi:hypothetical protein